MAKKKKRKKLTIPKTLGRAADKLYEIKQERLALQKEVDALKADEHTLREHIINTLPKSQASGVAGKLCQVSIVKKGVPTVRDWDKLYKHIKKTGDFDLLQRRLSPPAVKERWEDQKKVPGVEQFQAVDVSINKL